MESNIFTSLILPIALGAMMLGMGLSLVPEDFQRVGKYPKAVAIGLISQLLILPLIGLAIAKLLPMQPAIATGLMIFGLMSRGSFLKFGDIFSNG